MQTEIK